MSRPPTLLIVRLLCVLMTIGVANIGCGDDASGADASTSDVAPDVADDEDADVDDTGGEGDSGDAAVDVDAGEEPSGPLAESLCDPGASIEPYPAADAWEPNHGPGAPTVVFEEDAVFETCAYLDGGERDLSDHHNMVTMYDGYLLMPWAPEFGMGGLTFWDFSDPCSPEVRGTGFSELMRESHTVGFSSLGGRWAVVASVEQWLTQDGGGIMFWDVEDTSQPEPISSLNLPGFVYPDAYARVTLSTFWQAPYVYVGGSDNGVWIVDATDPRQPSLVGQHVFEPILRVGQVQVIGNLLIATAAEGPRAVLLDVSDPANPQPIPGGDFLAMDSEGNAREAYFTNFMGGYLFFVRKEGGGGLIVYDIRDPSQPTFVSDIHSSRNGGYVFLQEDMAFVGESSGAAIYDISDLENMSELAVMDLEGDLDTVTPIGNVAVLSVDDEANPDEGSSVIPWRAEPDARAPEVRFVWPEEGATNVPTSSRVGATLNEFADVKSAFEGSVRLYKTEEGEAGRVLGVASAQEVILNFHPFCPLEPNTEYTFEITAGGVSDVSGNAIAETFTSTFTTGAR